ncbi:hypothetical protein BH11PLA1_BH11PLA1_07620 [soil metagenome]
MPPPPNPLAGQVNMLMKDVQRLHQMLNAAFGELTLLRQRQGALDAANRLRDAGRKARAELVFRAQFGEDGLLWELLDGQLDGFYIEVGAFDGKKFSVSWAFDAIGWDGLLIEPIAPRFAECVKNRPHAHCVHAALSKRGATGTRSFNEIEGAGVEGMFSYLTTTPEHFRAMQETGRRIVSRSVDVTWMDKVLEEHPRKPKRVDVAVIDVEGGEIEVLEGFDLERWKPRILMLEDNERGANPLLGEWMAKHATNYVQVTWQDVNRVYVREDDEIMRRLRA